MLEEKKYIPELNGLRFFAFLLVFIHNSPEYSLGRLWELIHNKGWIGVDLFFCISAYLITKILTDEIRQGGTLNIKKFYIRRALRILPLYYIYIALAVLFIISDQGWDPTLPLHLIGIIFFIYNLVYLLLTYKMYIVFMHLWSISYEIQFYLIIPFIIKNFHAITKRNRLLVIFIFLITGNLIRCTFILLQVKHPAIYMLPVTHFEALFGGFILGSGTFDNSIKKINSWVVFLTGIICISLVLQLPDIFIIDRNLMVTYPLSGIGVTLIVSFVLHSDIRIVQQILKFKPIEYFGKISYGLYIYHLLAINLLYYFIKLKKIENGLGQLIIHQFVFMILSLLLTMIISSISYHWFEKPFLVLKLKHMTQTQ